jgi:hypothetical protein
MLRCVFDKNSRQFSVDVCIFIDSNLSTYSLIYIFVNSFTYSVESLSNSTHYATHHFSAFYFPPNRIDCVDQRAAFRRKFFLRI